MYNLREKRVKEEAWKKNKEGKENVEKYASLACYLTRFPNGQWNEIFLAMPRVIPQKLRFPFLRDLETEKENSLSTCNLECLD